jgi:uncharacterized protein Yka (UPF0111/DUF47 family)
VNWIKGFFQSRLDNLAMLKLREIYRHLSNVVDRGDEAANVISDVVVKMV